MYISIIISLIGLFLRFRTLGRRELLGDELFQFTSSDGAFKPFWLHNNYGDHTSFPGEYLLTYPMVRLFGLDKWGLAIPHILLTVLGFYILYLLCKRFYRTRAGLLVAFSAVALNYNLIYHSFEFRPYAGLQFLAIACLYFIDLIIHQYKELKPTVKCLAGALFIFTAAYHAYGLLILLLSFAFIFIYRISEEGWANLNRQGFWPYLVTLMVLAGLIWGWYASSNFFGLKANSQFYSLKDTFRYIPNPLSQPIGFIKGVLGNLIGYRPLYVLLLGPLLFFLLPRVNKFPQLIALLILVVLPLELILLVDLKTNYWFLQRQFVWVMPYFAFFLGWTWDSVILSIRNLPLCKVIPRP